MRNYIIGGIVLTSLLFGLVIGAIIHSLYPASVLTNKGKYEELVRLTLVCCSGYDYGRDVEELENEGDIQRAALMRSLGVTEIQLYPGNSEYPGGTIYLEGKVWGFFRTAYAYSLDGRPLEQIHSCYTVKHVEGPWYSGHSLPCLLHLYRE